MKQETTEWVEKAEGDLKVARRDARTDDPVWDVICFLAQQCAEKYLKAFLEEHNLAFQKTHDLIVLLNLCGALLPELAAWRPALAALGTFASAVRYPGVQTAQQDAEDALKTAEDVRAILRAKLGLT